MNLCRIKSFDKDVPKMIEEHLKGLGVQSQSKLLTKVNYARRVAEKLEKGIKGYVKKTVAFEFDEEGNFEWGEHRIKKVSGRRRFDEKKLLNSGNQEDIDTYLHLKKKYISEGKNYVKF